MGHPAEFRQIIEKAEQIVQGPTHLAEKIGVPKTMISDAKAGRRPLPDAACEKLAEIAKVDFGDVIRARMRQRGSVSCPFVLMLFALVIVMLFVTIPARAAQVAVLQTTSSMQYTLCVVWPLQRAPGHAKQTEPEAIAGMSFSVDAHA